MVRVRCATPLAGWTPVLHNPDDRVQGTLEVTGPGEALLMFRLTHSRWGREDIALRLGKYAVSMLRGDDELPVTPSPELLASLPYEQLLSRYRAAHELFIGELATLAPQPS